MSHYRQLPDGRWQKQPTHTEYDPQLVKAYYMRDNHTFLPLPLDLEEALRLMRNERDAGWDYGMLCGYPVDVVPEPVHAMGQERWLDFEKAARVWLAAAIAKSKPPEHMEAGRESHRTDS